MQVLRFGYIVRRQSPGLRREHGPVPEVYTVARSRLVPRGRYSTDAGGFPVRVVPRMYTLPHIGR